MPQETQTIRGHEQAKTRVDRASTWVGLIGGGFGVIATIAAGTSIVMKYFATNEDLGSVDCRHYFTTEIIAGQNDQLIWKEVYSKRREKAAAAEFTYDSDKTQENLEAYHEAVDRQNEAAEILKASKERVEVGEEGLKTCGYRVMATFSSRE